MTEGEMGDEAELELRSPGLCLKGPSVPYTPVLGSDTYTLLSGHVTSKRTWGDCYRCGSTACPPAQLPFLSLASFPASL